TSPRSSSSLAVFLPLRAGTGVRPGVVVATGAVRGAISRPVVVDVLAALVPTACWSPRLPRRLRSGPDTTNSSAASPATAMPDHTSVENTKPFAKSAIATPIFQNILIEPVRYAASGRSDQA